MQLDAARELKAALAAELLRPIVVSAAGETRGPAGAVGTHPSALGGSTRPVAAVTGKVPPVLALGLAVARGRGDFHLAVRVQQRTALSRRVVELIEQRARGEVEVRFIGAVVKRAAAPSPPSRQRRTRPLRVGLSVSHFAVTAGTLGCFVRDRANADHVSLLSNNHVLANENRGRSGDAIVQPGTFDGGTVSRDTVATLSRFVRLKASGGINRVDAALGRLTAGVDFRPGTLTGLGRLTGLGDEFLDEGTVVAKLGRTTGLTRGRVTAFELDNVTVGYDAGTLRFDDQIEVEGAGDESFSDGGDSGSLVVSGEAEGNRWRATGLLFAGSDQGGANGQGLTFVNPIRPVLDALRVDLLT